LPTTVQLQNGSIFIPSFCCSSIETPENVKIHTSFSHTQISDTFPPAASLHRHFQARRFQQLQPRARIQSPSCSKSDGQERLSDSYYPAKAGREKRTHRQEQRTRRDINNKRDTSSILFSLLTVISSCTQTHVRPSWNTHISVCDTDISSGSMCLIARTSFFLLSLESH
jgi:hypothetical protein